MNWFNLFFGIALEVERIGISARKNNTKESDIGIAAKNALNIATTSPQQDAEQPYTTVASTQKSTNNSKKSSNGKESGSTTADQTVMAVATSSSTNMEELERRRLFVPGILYHIKQQRQHGKKKMSIPTSPKELQATTIEDSLIPIYVVVRGVDPTERFGRIIVSKTIISDHSCPSYLWSISHALNSCSNP